jgi:predicted amidohydrolase YtcJ
LKGKNDFRWRIEHAQIVNESDFNLFSKYSIIPSVQPSHATSDMYWAKDRIGKERIKGAYAYKTLLNYAGLLAGGSDFPVEDINPLFGFYAAVSRKDQHNFPEGGFQKENAISRVEALKAMTIWPAFASFEENIKGSLEPNKFADFVILNEDLLNAPEQSLFNIKVQQTYSSGKVVFNRKKD